MAGTITSVENLGEGAYEYTWGGTSPFRVYQAGENVFGGTTELTSFIIEDFTDPLEPPAIEVLDSTDTVDAQQIQHPPFRKLQWRGILAAALYKVEQFVDAAWVERSVLFDGGAGYYQFQTAELTDESAEQWRITVIDARDHGSDTYEINFTMARNPAPPVIAGTYASGTGLLTITAR